MTAFLICTGRLSLFEGHDYKCARFFNFKFDSAAIIRARTMTPRKYVLKGLHTVYATILLIAPLLRAQDQPGTPAPAPSQPQAADASRRAVQNFDEVADKALAAMKKRAEDLHVKGVALVAYAEGDTVKSWTSKMVVVGHLTDAPDPNRKGNNLLGIAYSKAAEMADTLKDSGSKVRPVMLGEYGYQGGLVAKGKTGIIIVAFSGGPSEDDLKVSHAGLDIMVINL
jgi:hypothetical protein